MKKQGFTLIELLAVLIIIGIVAVITVPKIVGVMDDTKKESFRNSAFGLINSAQSYSVNASGYDSNGQIIFTCDSKKCSNNSGVELSFSGATPISGKVIVNKNGTHKLVSITDGIYCATGTSTTLKVDKSCAAVDDTPAIIDLTKLTTKSTTSSITVTLNDGFAIDEESDIKSYKYEIFKNNKLENTIESDSKEVTFEKLTNAIEYVIKITVINGNNLTSNISTKASTKDIGVPTYAITPTGWAKSKIVTITYPTRETDFVYSYSIDKGINWTEVASGTTQTVPFTSNGTVIARVYDGTNYKTASSYTVTGIDTTAPTASLVVNSKTTNTITVTGSGTDDQSGVAKYEFAIDSGAYVNNGTNTSYTYSGVTTGTHTLRVRVTDNAGNTKESSTTSSPNEITAPTYAINKTGWQTSKIVTITYPTRQTGFVYSYSTNGGTSWATVASGTTQTVSFTNNGSVIARIYDGTNYKTASSYTVTGIDATAPTCGGYSGGSTSWTTGNRTISVGCVDSESGCTASSYSQTFTSDATTATTSITIRDNVGHTRTCSSTQNIYIDKTLPTISYSLGGGTYNGNQTITVTANEANFSYMHVHVYGPNGFDSSKSVTAGTSKSKAVTLTTGNWTIYSYAVDAAGNKQNQSPDNGGGWLYQNYAIREYSQSSACTPITQTIYYCKYCVNVYHNPNAYNDWSCLQTAQSGVTTTDPAACPTRYSCSSLNADCGYDTGTSTTLGTCWHT